MAGGGRRTDDGRRMADARLEVRRSDGQPFVECGRYTAREGDGMRTAFFIALIVFVATLSAGGEASAQQAGRWDRVLDLPSSAVQSVTFADDDTAWAAGAGAIFRSGDGGRTWSTARTTRRGYLADIEAAPGGTRGWAVGVLGQLLITDDGGVTWTEGDPGTDLNLSHVEALDEQTVLVAGIGFGLSDAITLPQPATFRRSDDGGVTWSVISLGGYELRGLEGLYDGRHAWASGERCEQIPNQPVCGVHPPTLFRTDDGGETWSPVATGHRFSEMHFVSAEAGWAVEFACVDAVDYGTCRPIVSRTDDGGATWAEALALPNNTPAALWAVSGSAASVATTSCTQTCTTTLQQTTDGGTTWTPVGGALPGYASDLAFNDGGAGVLTLGDVLQWTDDGGRTLHPAEFPITAGGGGFDFIDANNGWFAASKLLRTTDAGETFEPISDFRPDEIDFVSETVGWATDLICEPACGNRVEISRTRDGGRTWEFLYAHQLGNYLELNMMDERRGWAHSLSDGLLLRTADGGTTWTQLAVPGAATLDFVDANIAWAGEVACESRFDPCETRLWRLVDGASSWTEVSSPPFVSEGCSLQLEALDATYAWATMYWCREAQVPVLFRTRDGGASWQQADVGATGQVGELAFFDRFIGRGLRAVCPGVLDYCDTVIMRTSDGGATWTHEPLPRDLSVSVSSQFADDQFAGPEQIWIRVTHGGGLLAVSGRELWRYRGSQTIVAPNTGDGRDDAGWWWSLLVALLAGGIVTVAAGLRAVRTLGRA
jgi:photosystem II stability/assembly factor-like uncharacterized protein